MQRQGGTVALKVIGDAIARVQLGTDRTAAELTLRRLRDDFEALQQQRIQFYNQAAQTEGGDQVVLFIVLAFFLVGCFVLIAFDQEGFAVISLVLALTLPIGVIASNAKTRERHGEALTAFDAQLAAIEAKIDEQRKQLDT